MTLAVLWYRQQFDELWCASDSRITLGSVIATDSGPKVLPVPVICHKSDGGHSYSRSHSHSFGFAFAGSSLAAISTHALVTACTQNLAPATEKNPEAPPSLESVAELFRTVAEHYISDLSSRATGSSNREAFFFYAFIYGFCPVKKAFEAFGIAPNIQGPTLKVLRASMRISPGYFHPMGSGAESFVKLNEEVNRTHKNPGVIVTLREMLKRETVPTVGGHFQVGVARRSGFELRPILNLREGPLNRTVTFLGWNVDSIGPIDGYRIGYEAFSPDVD